MNPDELREEILHQRDLQKEYRKRLRALEKQAAKFGIYVPPHIQIEIDEMNEKIQDYEQKIEMHKQVFVGFKRKQIEEHITKLNLLSYNSTEITYIDFLGLDLKSEEQQSQELVKLNTPNEQICQIIAEHRAVAQARKELKGVQQKLSIFEQEISEIENL